MLNCNEEKKRLLLDLKEGTLNQLAAVQAEDPEQFLKNTEWCSSIIATLSSPNMKELRLEREMNEIIKEIIEIRTQISILIPPLYEKLKHKYTSEKQNNLIKRRYNYENSPVNSIFLDKKI